MASSRRTCTYLLRSSLFCALLFASSCGENQVTVNGPGDDPPRIVLQGPEYPPSAEYEFRAPDPYVVVGDRQGLDDISVVLLSLDELRILGAVTRSPMQGSCGLVPNYSVPGAVDLMSLLPPSITGFQDWVLEATTGGYYTYGRFLSIGEFSAGPTSSFAFETLSPSLGREVNAGCLSGDYLMRLGVYPPAYDPPRTIFVTALEVEYVGLRFVVYDGAGNSAVASFANFRILYRTRTERDLATPMQRR